MGRAGDEKGQCLECGDGGGEGVSQTGQDRRGMRGSVFELIPLWLTGVFLDITDLKVATRPASRSCGKWLKLLRGGAAAALHCPGPPPQLQGESWGHVRGLGDAQLGKHTAVSPSGTWDPGLHAGFCPQIYKGLDGHFLPFWATLPVEGGPLCPRALHLAPQPRLETSLPQPSPNILLHKATRLEIHSLKVAYCAFLLKLGCRTFPHLC